MELKKKAAELDQRMNDQERYSRRWCLRLHWVAENSSENVKERVKEVCRAVVPEELRNEVTAAVDIAHRLGRLRAGEDQPNRHHQIYFKNGEGSHLETRQAESLSADSRLTFQGRSHSRRQGSKESTVACGGPSQKRRQSRLFQRG